MDNETFLLTAFKVIEKCGDDEEARDKALAMLANHEASGEDDDDEAE